MLPGKVPHCHFYFVALIAPVAKRLLIRVSFLNCKKRQARLAPNCLIFSPSNSASQNSSHLCPPFPLKNEYKARLHVESTEKPVDITVENAYSLFKP